MQIYWVIQRIADGKILQKPKSRSNSYAGFDGYLPPRLFMSKLSAQRALSAWCKGTWMRSDWESLPYPSGKDARPANEYQIITVTLVPTDAEPIQVKYNPPSVQPGIFNGLSIKED